MVETEGHLKVDGAVGGVQPPLDWLPGSLQLPAVLWLLLKKKNQLQ